MGMGDNKTAPRPASVTYFDPVQKASFADSLMRECPYPAVQERYGKGTKVSVYTCRKCRYGVRQKLFAGWGCSYDGGNL